MSFLREDDLCVSGFPPYFPWLRFKTELQKTRNGFSVSVNPMNILLVEDEEGLIITLTDRLRSEGFAVTSATDGVAGLSLAREKSFDLIMLDIMLPKKNGYDVCRDLRQQGITTPVLMLTAKGETIDKVLGLKLGADD